MLRFARELRRKQEYIIAYYCHHYALPRVIPHAGMPEALRRHRMHFLLHRNHCMHSAQAPQPPGLALPRHALCQQRFPLKDYAGALDAYSAISRAFCAMSDAHADTCRIAEISPCQAVAESDTMLQAGGIFYDYMHRLLADAPRAYAVRSMITRIGHADGFGRLRQPREFGRADTSRMLLCRVAAPPICRMRRMI